MRIQLLEAAAQSGRRYENDDTAAQRLSGAIMLGMTNDGFLGPQSIDMFKIDKPSVFDLYAYDVVRRTRQVK